jgi:hypothetical protein
MSIASFDSVFGILLTIGPFILLGILAYMVLNWRHGSRAQFAKGEQAARDLYESERARNDNFKGVEKSGADNSGLSPARPTPPD